jgi:hypothetical protein
VRRAAAPTCPGCDSPDRLSGSSKLEPAARDGCGRISKAERSRTPLLGFRTAAAMLAEHSFAAALFRPIELRLNLRRELDLSGGAISPVG